MKNKKGLGKIDFFMLGFGSMIGVGWTVSLNTWYQQAGGAFPAMLAFFIGTFAVIPIGLCYGEMTGALPVAGGVMAFAYRARGPKLSFIGSWLVALAYVVLLPWEIIYISKVIGLFIPSIAKYGKLYQILGEPIFLGTLLIGVIITALMFLINVLGSNLAGKIQTRLSSLILIIAGILMFASVFVADFSNLLPIYSSVRDFNHTNFFQGFISLLVIVPFFLSGFDAIPQAIEDAHSDIKPKHISRILVLSIAAAGLFYVGIIFTSSLAMNWEYFKNLETPPLAFMFSIIYPGKLGTILYYVTLIGALSGLMSTYNGMFIASSRLLASMGNARLLPAIFAKENKKNIPIFSVIFCAIMTLVGPIFGEGLIRPLTSVGSTAFVLGWLITCVSTWILRSKEPDLRRPIIAGRGRIIIFISMIICSVLVLLSVIPISPGYMGLDSLIILISWIIIGMIFFFVSQNTGETITEKKRKKLIFQDVVKNLQKKKIPKRHR